MFDQPVVITEGPPLPSAIPTISVSEDHLNDPIQFIDAQFDTTITTSAFKFRLPENCHLPPPPSLLNPQQFWFHTSKQLLNPPLDDLESRLRFFRQLGSLVDSPPMVENRPVDFYRLYNLVKVTGNDTDEKWQDIARQLGYKFINEEVVTGLRHAYGLMVDTPPVTTKRQRKEAPLVPGSARIFPRTLWSRSAKGFLLNLPQFISLKPPVIIQQSASIRPQTQIHAVVRAMYENKAFQVDDLPLATTPASTSLYSLAQFVDRDRFFVEYLKEKFQLGDETSVDKLEGIFLQLLQEDESVEIDSAIDVDLRVHGSVFPTTSDDVLDSKFYGSESAIGPSLSPWALDNLAFLPNSMLSALAEGDLNNSYLVTPRAQVGMTFSLSNWRYQDQFCQLVNYHVVGAPKKWYFINEASFDKFAELIANQQDNNRVHINNNNWKGYHGLVKGQDSHVVAQCLQSMINTTTEPRLQHKAGINDTTPLQYNQEHWITPAMLDDAGISYTMTIQHPGEYVVVAPKVWCCSMSLGVNVAEEVNVATPKWLNYAIPGETWLRKQHILPAFSSFKLLSNTINSPTTPKQFSGEVGARAANLLSTLIDDELAWRQKLRLTGVREVPLDERGDQDFSDDDLRWCALSKVVVSHNGEKFITSIDTYLDKYQSDDYKAEVQYIYSDDKLRQLQKSDDFSTDYTSWMSQYREMVMHEVAPSLKTYKTVFGEGEAILTGLYTSQAALTGTEPESPEFLEFLDVVNNLRKFIASAEEFVEECQALLAIKHSQRVRKGQDVAKMPLADFISVVDKVESLNLSSPEIEQVLELEKEILNFDKASRALLGKSRASEVEFDDLINLGQSFGIDIPALSFITRIRDRMQWQRTFAVIEKGGDPFADSKEVFTLHDLHQFHRKGREVLSKRDQEMIDRIKMMVEMSEQFDKDVRKFLEFEYADDVDELQLEKYAETFRTQRLFLPRETYDRLSKVFDNRKLIEKVKAMSTTSYSELKAVFTAIEESELKFRNRGVGGDLETTEKVVGEFNAALKTTKVVTTMDKSLRDISTKGALIPQLVHKLYQLLYKADYSFAEKDSYWNSSSYLERSGKELPDAHAAIYCVCREVEFGTMVECERCSEWYHIMCVKSPTAKKVEDVFVCGPCRVVAGDNKAISQQIGATEFCQWVEKLSQLKAVPVAEIDVAKEVVAKIGNHRQWVRHQFKQVENLEADNATKMDYLMYLARKMCGAGVLLREELEDCLMEYKRLEGVGEITVIKKDNQSQPEPAEIPVAMNVVIKLEKGSAVVQEKESSDGADDIFHPDTTSGVDATDHTTTQVELTTEDFAEDIAEDIATHEREPVTKARAVDGGEQNHVILQTLPEPDSIVSDVITTTLNSH